MLPKDPGASKRRETAFLDTILNIKSHFTDYSKRHGLRTPRWPRVRDAMQTDIPSGKYANAGHGTFCYYPKLTSFL
jgi:hypothetical protein